MTVNLVDGWFCDRSPGSNSGALARFGTSSTSGIVGVGVSSIPASLPVLPAAGDTIPGAGAFSPISGMTRQQINLSLSEAVGFTGATMLYGWTPPADAISWSMSLWVNYGVSNTSLFIPDRTLGCFYASNNGTGDPAGDQLIQFIPSLVDVGDGASPGPALQVDTSDPVNAPFVSTDFSFPSDRSSNSGWIHLMASLKLSTNSVLMQLYADDTQIINQAVAGGPFTGGKWRFSTAAFSDANGLHTNGIGNYQVLSTDPGTATDQTANGVNGKGLYCAMAECWMSEGQYIDWSKPSNRAKFHISSNDGQNYAPCNLGRFGQLPTGTKPTVYLRGGPSLFTTNRATGTATSAGSLLTLIGSLTSISDPPV